MAEPFIRSHQTFNSIIGLPEHTEAGISTRHGGFSAPPFQSLNLGLHVKDQEEHVLKNRELLAEHFGIPLERWVFADQVHGNQLHKVNRNDAGKGSKAYNTGIMGTDGLYTTEKNIVLALAYADCVPIFFTTKGETIIGIAHAGWKGTVQGIAAAMVETWFEDEGIPYEEIEVVIGPSIQKCCYEVDERVISQVENLLHKDDERPYTINSTTDTFQLDLQQLNRNLLVRAGIPNQNIQVSDHCTSCHVSEFFSHRKENGQTGRMLGFIAMST